MCLPSSKGRDLIFFIFVSKSPTQSRPPCGFLHFREYHPTSKTESGILESKRVTQSCPTLLTPKTVAHQALLSILVLQARILEWVVISFSRGSFWPRDQTRVSGIAGRFFTIWATREAEFSKPSVKSPLTFLPSLKGPRIPLIFILLIKCFLSF